jgi:hypothetical protein
VYIEREGLMSGDAFDRIEWYRRCLEDVMAGRAVRGLAEAKAGYESAIAELRKYEPKFLTEQELKELKKGEIVIYGVHRLVVHSSPGEKGHPYFDVPIERFITFNYNRLFRDRRGANEE